MSDDIHIMQFEPEGAVTATGIGDIAVTLFDGDMMGEAVKQISAEIQIERSDGTIKVRRVPHSQIIPVMPVEHRQNLLAFMAWLRDEAETRILGG